MDNPTQKQLDAHEQACNVRSQDTATRFTKIELKMDKLVTQGNETGTSQKFIIFGLKWIFGIVGSIFILALGLAAKIVLAT